MLAITPIRAALGALLGVALAAAIALGGAPATAHAADPLLAPAGKCRQDSNTTADLLQRRNAIFCLINHARRTAKLTALRCYGEYDECVSNTQREHARLLSLSSNNKAFDVRKCPRDGHNACGRPFDFWMTYFKYPFRIRGELIANGLSSARAAMAFWLRTPSARAQILTSQYVDMGVGIVQPAGSNLRSLWVAHLANRYLKIGKAPATPAPCTNTDVLVTQLTAEQAEAAVLCLTNEKRRAHGLSELTRDTTLAATARSHADKSVALRFWNVEDGRFSHDDPEVDDPNEDETPEFDADVRIRNAGYCAAGQSWHVAENTFAWAGTETRIDPPTNTYAPTARGAVEWWYHSPWGHRDTMLDPQLRQLGVGVARGYPFPGDAGDAPAGAFVQHYGRCG